MGTIRRHLPLCVVLLCVCGLSLAGCSTVVGAAESLGGFVWHTIASPFTTPGADATHPGVLRPTGLGGELDSYLRPVIVLGLVIGFIGFCLSFVPVLTAFIPRTAACVTFASALGLVIAKFYLALAAPWIIGGCCVVAAFIAYTHFVAAARVTKSIKSKGKPHVDSARIRAARIPDVVDVSSPEGGSDRDGGGSA